MRNTLRLFSVLALSASTAFTGVRAQNVAINTTGAAPNAKALLDIDVSGILTPSLKRGLLIPRMTRVSSSW